MFDLINNTSKLLGDDLKKEIKGGSKLRIAASCFSIYAFNALKTELEQINELKFLFTTPTLIDEQVTDKVKKQRREFFIPKLSESGLCGTEFEIRLKNQMTQKAIARECAEWLRAKVQIKTLKEPVATQSMINIETSGEYKHYITELAYKYGYDSPESFLKAFKRFHGITPSQVKMNVS